MAFSSYFEVNVTPTQRRNSGGGDATPILDFRPFAGNPKIIFKNIPVGDSVSRSIVLRNPQNAVLEVELVKLPPQKACLTFSDKKIQLQPGHEFTLKVFWLPKTEGKSIYSVHLQTNTNSRHHISIVCVSVPRKKKKVVKTNSKQSTSNKKIVLKSGSSLTTKNKLSVPTQKTPQISGNAENLDNISSETYDILSPEPRNLTAELQEIAINSVFPDPLITTPRMNNDDLFLSSVGFSPFPTFPVQKSSRETFSLVPTASYLCSSVKAKGYKQSQSSIPELNISNDSLSPLSSPKNMSFPSSLFSEQQKPFLPVEKCVKKRDNENFDLPDGKEIRELGDDLNISGLSEIENILAKKSMKCEIDNLELPFSPITPLHRRRKIDTPTLHKSLLGELPVNEENVDSKMDRFFESDAFKFTPISFSKPGGIRQGTSGSDSTSFLEEAKHFSTPFRKQMPSISEEMLYDRGGNVLKEIQDESEITSLHKGNIGHNSSIFMSCETQFKDIPGESKKTVYYSASKSSNKDCVIEDNSISFFQFTSRKISDIPVLEERIFQTEQEKYLLISPPKKSIKTRIKENIAPKSSVKKSVQLLSSKLSSSRKVKRDLSERVSGKTSAKKIPPQAISKLKLIPKSKKNLEKELILMDADKVLNEQINPSYCITSTLINPFLDCNVYYDQEWFDSREKEFVRWLNVLLTPPEQLSSSDELPKVDVADLWKRSCKMDVAPAPSRETVSSLYLVNHRLDSLRRKACAMFKSPPVSQVLSKVVVQIDKGILSIRKDRNVVRDIGLKCTAVELLLCYNPLWLRIGMETIMGRTMVIKSNSDIIGITSFIAQYLLSDPYLVQRFCYPGVTNMFKPGFEETIKKHILKKFFCLVFFLDYAKQNKLIVHNPCLFCRDACYKESREILLAFAREFLAGIGDITKHLRTLGYVVQHKQTYLDEFSYAVTKLGSDLRDGVRLTRVTEIILQEPSLSCTLRVPAVSILQKIHNVKVALSALSKAGHILEGNITARDIVEGHKEKTMSLLWQIIYRFQLTRFTYAANRIQNWYRSLAVLIRRRIFLKEEAARKKAIEDKACTIIQKHWRRYVAVKQYAHYIESANKIKCWYKSVTLMKREREQFLKKRNAAIKIQRFVRNFHLKKRIGKLEEARMAVLKISLWYQGICLMRRERDNYKRMTKNTIIIQRWFRSTLYARKCRKEYLSSRSSVLKIQRWFRSVIEVKRSKELFLKQKSATIYIQRKLRATILMREIKHDYETKKHAVCKIKQWYRACYKMRYQRAQYLSLRSAAVKIQRFFRFRSGLKRIRSNIRINKLAVRKIELWYEATILMKEERQNYLLLRKSIITVQRKYRAKLIGRSHKEFFELQRKSVLVIQKWFRSILLMRAEIWCYREERNAAIVIQQWFRTIMVTKKQRHLYLRMKGCAVRIQKWYRASKLMQEDSKDFQSKKVATRTIQCWYRGITLMKQQRKQFLAHKFAAITIQRMFRAHMMRKRKLFNLQHNSALVIQQWYKTLKLMKLERKNYLRKRKAVLTIQQWWRALTISKELKLKYENQKRAALIIQNWYRCCIAMQRQRNEYLNLKKSVLIIQSYFRALERKKDYQNKRMAAVKIQHWLRAIYLGRKERENFLKICRSAVRIQTWYRHTKVMKQNRMVYLSYREAAVTIQRKYRAWQLGKSYKMYFELLRISAIKIQKWYRAVCKMIIQKKQYDKLKRAATIVQGRFRAKVICKEQRNAFLLKRNSVVKIQRWYRSRIHLEQERHILSAKNETCFHHSRRFVYNSAEEKAAVKVIEVWYHSIISKRKLAEEIMLKQQKCAIKIQSFWKGYKVRKELKKTGCLLKQSKKYVLNEAMSLRALYTKSLGTFCVTSSYAMVTRSAIMIESCTRLSCELCEQFFKSEQLFVLVYLLNSSNRSVPAEQLLVVLMKILIHVLNHPDGARHLLSQEPGIIVPTLLNLSNVWCMKKHETLFCLICSVWCLLARDLNQCQVLGKKEMTQQLEKCYNKVMKWRNVTSKHTTNQKEKNQSVLLAIWAQRNKNEEYIFHDGSYAVIQVLKKLNIHL